jgi:diguanylate cyclase (GGDEF)-like protein
MHLFMDGTWLCPTPLDRARLREMEQALSMARAVMYSALGLGAAISAVWLGWWILAPLAAVVATGGLIRPHIATSRRPEHLIAAQVAFAQVMLGLTVALTGGAESPVLLVAFLPLLTLPARFGSRGMHAGAAFTVLVLTAAVLTDVDALAASPPPFVFSLVAVIGLAAFSDLMYRTEMRQRAGAILDPLTGLLNRSSLDRRFEELRQQASLTGAPVSLLVCDVDHFKSVNDAHGHACGDAVLKDVGYQLRRHMRTFELIYRVGGDELVVVLPGRSAAQAVEVAERLRAAIEAARPGGLELTVSVGVASAVGDQVRFKPLFDAADRALYAAKAAGRNRVAADSSSAVARV